jgi:NADP-dependent 3-hydroxy acid dehydrogenase YdfG
MLSSAGRVVLVSGANRGIGFAIANQLYDTGFTVSLGARDLASLEPLTSAWTADRFCSHIYEAEDHGTHQRWVDGTVARFGRIDGLVNNAGIQIPIDLDDADDDMELDRLWAVNVKAPLSATRKAMPFLRQSGSGRVINVASIAGKAVFDSGIGYSMSKFALVALSHATRHAGWEDGVRCTALCPGYVSTDLTTEVASIAQQDMIEPGDIAELVVTVMRLSNSASVAELTVNCMDGLSM